MKKILPVVLTVLLCLTAFAAMAETRTLTVADFPVIINTAGEHTLILSSVSYSAGNSPAINITSPDAKVTLILADGSDSIFTNSSWSEAVIDTTSSSLVITCEKAAQGIAHECDNTCGTLEVQGHINGGGAAAIGSDTSTDFTGSITINGGNVTAIGVEHASGIGAGAYGSCKGTVVINGGNVTASSGLGAAIGGSSPSNGSITINGGKVDARGFGAGLGTSWGDFSGAITINDGTVYAASTYYGVGIGANNFNGFSGSVTINGGKVTAEGQYSGIGGRGNFSGTLTIAGGEVTAFAEEGLAIGAGADGVIQDKAVIVADPVSGSIEAEHGADAASAVPFAGSPFLTRTNLKPLLGTSSYAHFLFTPGAVQPGAANASPTLPRTGDGTNLALLAALIVLSALGLNALRRKHEA